MASRKKQEWTKAEITDELQDIFQTALGNKPKVEKGSHLTVTTHLDGRTELVWDDEALLRDVRLAILTAESKIPAATETKPKTKRKKTAS